jgi:HipA-like protein
MRKAKVLFKGEEAGILTQQDDGSFMFKYNPLWVDDASKPAISPTLPKKKTAYHAPFLFAFFYNMLPEGSNRQVASRLNRIDQRDHFGLLMTTARHDTIGAVTVYKIEDQ